MDKYAWLRPTLEAEIKFAEWTTSGLLRHAEFVTLLEAWRWNPFPLSTCPWFQIKVD